MNFTITVILKGYSLEKLFLEKAYCPLETVLRFCVYVINGTNFLSCTLKFSHVCTRVTDVPKTRLVSIVRAHQRQIKVTKNKQYIVKRSGRCVIWSLGSRLRPAPLTQPLFPSALTNTRHAARKVLAVDPFP